MFTNRRPPPKSPAAPKAAPSDSTDSTATPSATSTLSDRIKTQVRQRPTIQTKVTTVVKTVTRKVAPPKPKPTPLPVPTTKAKAKATTTNTGRDTKPKPKPNPKPRAKTTPTASGASSDESSESGSSSSTHKPRTNKRRRTTHSNHEGGYESSSSLSSADEDYFSGRLGTSKPVEGAPVCVRNVSTSTELEEELAGARIVSSEEVVRANLGAYIVNFFADPTNPDASPKEWCDGQDMPVVELEYPAVNGRERFALLAPRKNDEYNPIEDLMVTIVIILEYFLTPAQALSHFGYTPGSSFSSFSSFLKPLALGSALSSNATSNEPSSVTSRSNSPAIAQIGTPNLATPEPSSISMSTSTSSNGAIATPLIGSNAEPLLRSLEKARNRRDGPTFVRLVHQFNATLVNLKQSGLVRDNIRALPGLHSKVWTKVFHQCYDRTVGPDIEHLRRYAAFSDNVYGELLPKFMNEIFDKVSRVLGPGKTFVDLGSGVGNCVVQAALATGADSYGFENMPHASHLARLQLNEARTRFTNLWGLSSGKMECHEADFCEHPLVPQILKKADVVLVNNEVFTAALNDRLTYLFLDLPEHSYLVSLKPFLPPSFKLSSHNLNHPLAYLSQRREQYKPGSVSWKMEGGSYFVAQVDRGRLERWVDKQQRKEVERNREKDERRNRRSESASVAMSRPNSRQ
ncbi:histone methyltransferase DOT1 [Sporobolomyces koalae]|uniref:histone methyltransferase DOT1 n=1 Tax=Sporobolomyces koalae TaxID=500713 RepID=UPI00317C86A8